MRDVVNALGSWLQALGLVAEIGGVALMANAYLGLAKGGKTKLSLLCSVLFRGSGSDRGRGAETLYEAGFSGESYTKVIRGLALIGLGFVAQLIALVLAW